MNDTSPSPELIILRLDRIDRDLENLEAGGEQKELFFGGGGKLGETRLDGFAILVFDP